MENWFSPALVLLIHELEQPGAYVAFLLVMAACPLAWGLARLMRGPGEHPGSIWLEGKVAQGLLFPVLWLLLVWLARVLCHHLQLPLAVFRLAMPLQISLAGIRLVVRVLRAAFSQSHVVRVIERTVSWLAWAGVGLWITGVLPSVVDALDDIKWNLHGSTISLATVIEGMLSAGLVLTITLWISAALEARLLRGALGGEQLSLRKAVANSVRALLVFVGLIVALEAVGIDLTALSVVGGAFGVGLGLGLQKLAANYVSGFVILTERALRIGDTVKVDGFEGRIADIAGRYTVLRALNGRESVVPNEMMITSRVESATLADSRLMLSTEVQVAYGTDLDRLFPAIVAAVTPVPRVLSDPLPSAYLSNFAADGLELTICYWIVDPENGTLDVRSDVNRLLLRLFNERGIEIPFPQRVVRSLQIDQTLQGTAVVPGG